MLSIPKIAKKKKKDWNCEHEWLQSARSSPSRLDPARKRLSTGIGADKQAATDGPGGRALSLSQVQVHLPGTTFLSWPIKTGLQSHAKFDEYACDLLCSHHSLDKNPCGSSSSNSGGGCGSSASH